MATTQVQRRRGTTTQTAAFTGAAGELTIDTTKNTTVVHDGATAGGFPALREDLANNTNVATKTYVTSTAQTQTWGGTAGGTANALTLSPTPAPTAYAAGQIFRFKAALANTAAVTVAVSTLSAIAVQASGVALAGGEIVAGLAYELIYDGTYFQITRYSEATDFLNAVSWVANVTALQTLKKVTLASGQQVELGGYASVGDGGGGIFNWSPASAVTADNGTIFASGEGGTGRWLRNLPRPGVVTPEYWGAKGDGVTDDTTAVKAAVAWVKARGSGQVDFGGKYYLTSEVLIDFDGCSFIGVARGPSTGGASLLGGTANQNILHISSSYNTFRNLHLKTATTGVSALRVTPAVETQTTTLVNQNYNTFDNVFIEGAAEAIVMQCGPFVAGASGCFYNTFSNVQILNCLRSVWMKDGPNASSSGVNRNTFIACRAGSTGGGQGNTGVQIDSGGTNEFHKCDFEGINLGTSPNTTPTAIKIAASGLYSGPNNSNKFFGGTCEACTADMVNANADTEIYGTLLTDSKCTFTALPMVMVAYDPSILRQVLPGYEYQSNNQDTAIDNNSVWARGANGFASKVYDVREQADTAGVRSRSSLVWVNTIASGGSTTVTIIPSSYINPAKAGIFISGILQFQAADPTPYIVYGEWRLIVHITSGALSQWGQVKIYDQTSLGTNDWRASSAGLSVSAVAVTGGALTVTIAAATQALTKAQLVFNYEMNSVS